MRFLIFTAILLAAQISAAKYCNNGWLYEDSGSTVLYAGSQDDCLATLNSASGKFYCSNGWLYKWSDHSTVAYIGAQKDCNVSFHANLYCSNGWIYNISGATQAYIGSQEDCTKAIGVGSSTSCSN